MSLRAELRVLSGARAGHVERLQTQTLRLGRAADAELRFDPERDREVSALHATLTLENGAWWLRDAQSTNGTFVNGQRIEQPTALRNGDRLTIGRGGPELEFVIPSATPSGRTQELHVVRGRARRWQVAAVLSALALTAVIAALLLWSRGERRAWERERRALLAARDSVLAATDATVGRLQGQMDGLADALRAAQGEVRRIAERLERDGKQAPQLQAELKGAIAELNSQRSAAAIDYETIRRGNEKAVAKLYAESASGALTAGTAFAVRSDATLLTNRHLVQDEDGTHARRIAIQFALSDQVWPARILHIDQENDLALIKVDAIVGGVPTVQAFSDGSNPPRAGTPMLSIGFPLGGESIPSDRVGKTIIKPLIGAAVVASVGPKEMEALGYGATGSSGSPLFDGSGAVVGVVLGGRSEAGKHYLVAIPASAAQRLLSRLR